MEFLVQTYSKLNHGVSHVGLQQTVSDLVRYLIEKEDEQKEEKEPVKVGVERPYKLTPYEEELKDRDIELVRPALERMQREVERRWQEARYGLKEQPQDMETEGVSHQDANQTTMDSLSDADKDSIHLQMFPSLQSAQETMTQSHVEHASCCVGNIKPVAWPTIVTQNNNKVHMGCQCLAVSKWYVLTPALDVPQPS